MSVMEIELPSSYHLADQTSLSGQSSSIRNIRIQLSLLLVAGVASAVSWKAGRLDIAALIAGVAFVGGRFAPLEFAVDLSSSALV